MDRNQIKSLSLRRVAEMLAGGSLTSVELCNACLERCSELEPEINAFLKIDAESVKATAAESDDRRARGKTLSPYDGIPVAVKDCIVEKNRTCSCGSQILENVISPYDSTVVSRIKCRGLIPFGRANMDEFAMGSSCENSAFKKTANPWDLSRVPGGSSGGSAACVAAGEVPVSLGSDTGGSIRQPAAFCGVTGLKPTYGRVSRYGLVAFASSLDQIGPLGREVHDTAVMLDIIGGHDPLDSTSVPEECGGFANAVETAGSSGFEGLKIGIPEEYFNLESVSSGVKNCLNKSRKLLSSLGAELVPVSLPHTKYAVAVYYIIATAEASANLARFDGIRYGKRAGIKDLNGIYFKSRGEGFGDEVKRRIILGTYVLSSGYYDAYYLRAQKARTLIRKDFEKAFEKCNLLFTPATPAPAFKFGEKSDPLQMYLADVFTIALNLAGNCGISLPADIDDETGMPIGVQFIAPPFAEASMLKVAKTFESNRAIRSFVPDI